MTRVAAWMLAIAALFCAGSADAGAKTKKLRAEVAELRERIARLESQASFLMRRESRPASGAVAPGIPGNLCTDPCSVDSDGDGVGDCDDPCPCDKEQKDTDGDGTADCLDPCPDDATDACIDPCRADTDGDGTTDCTDPCPWDPASVRDTDGDGMPDCADPCPADRKNACATPCPLDADGDGQKDCTDPCPWGIDPSGACVVPPPPPPPGGCFVGGCSGQVCSDRPSDPTTCEWQPQYACYREATCERQADGACGWTRTEAFAACMAKTPLVIR